MSYKFSRFEKNILKHSKSISSTIVLPEGAYDKRVYDAAMYLAKHRIAHIIILSRDKLNVPSYGGYLSAHVMDEGSTKQFSERLFEKRKDRGLSLDEARELVGQPMYYAAMMLDSGLCDGVVCGAQTTSQDTFRAALQVIGSDGLVSSFMLMECKDEPMIFADCAFLVDPTAEQLSSIAISSVDSYRRLISGVPRLALLSYSTKGSGAGESVDKVRQAREILDKSAVDFIYDGEYQMDSAVSPVVAATKAKTGNIQGDANILIFPNLDAGNIGYKAVSHFGDCRALGPICQGFRKPVNDLSRGASVEEIILVVAITSLQTHKEKNL